MKFDTKKFKADLRGARTITNDITLRQLSAKTGISPATLSRLENGGMPAINHLATLCKYLKTPIETYFK